MQKSSNGTKHGMGRFKTPVSNSTPALLDLDDFIIVNLEGIVGIISCCGIVHISSKGPRGGRKCCGYRYWPNQSRGHVNTSCAGGSVKGAHKSSHRTVIIGVIRVFRKAGVNSTRRARGRNSHRGSEIKTSEDNTCKASRVSVQVF